MRNACAAGKIDDRPDSPELQSGCYGQLTEVTSPVSFEIGFFLMADFNEQ
jgi:hypothetical protein